MKKFAALFGAFFRIGLFTFGGGYAMLPMLQREVVEKHGWATEDEILDTLPSVSAHQASSRSTQLHL